MRLAFNTCADQSFGGKKESYQAIFEKNPIFYVSQNGLVTFLYTVEFLIITFIQSQKH